MNCEEYTEKKALIVGESKREFKKTANMTFFRNLVGGTITLGSLFHGLSYLNLTPPPQVQQYAELQQTQRELNDLAYRITTPLPRYSSPQASTIRDEVFEDILRTNPHLNQIEQMLQETNSSMEELKNSPKFKNYQNCQTKGWLIAMLGCPLGALAFLANEGIGDYKKRKIALDLERKLSKLEGEYYSN